jgi:CheY-like chemotaxis protein
LQGSLLPRFSDSYPRSLVPAIALTGYATSKDRERALSAGYQLHLAKPVEPEELVAAILDLLGQQREASKGRRQKAKGRKQKAD